MLLIADRKQSKKCIKRHHREEIRDSTARFEYGDSTKLILQTGGHHVELSGKAITEINVC